nr:hypothetical protein CFP56_00665 [Quercus suber]
MTLIVFDPSECVQLGYRFNLLLKQADYNLDHIRSTYCDSWAAYGGMDSNQPWCCRSQPSLHKTWTDGELQDSEDCKLQSCICKDRSSESLPDDLESSVVVPSTSLRVRFQASSAAVARWYDGFWMTLVSAIISRSNCSIGTAWCVTASYVWLINVNSADLTGGDSEDQTAQITDVIK